MTLYGLSPQRRGCVVRHLDLLKSMEEAYKSLIYLKQMYLLLFKIRKKKTKKKTSNISVIAHWAVTPSTMAPAAWTCLISIRNAYSSASLWSTKHYDNIRAKPRKTLCELFVWLMLSATSLRGSATWVCQWSAHCTLYSLCCLWITWSV